MATNLSYVTIVNDKGWGGGTTMDEAKASYLSHGWSLDACRTLMFYGPVADTDITAASFDAMKDQQQA